MAYPRKYSDDDLLCAVAECKTFSAAARRLGVSVQSLARRADALGVESAWSARGPRGKRSNPTRDALLAMRAAERAEDLAAATAAREARRAVIKQAVATRKAARAAKKAATAARIRELRGVGYTFRQAGAEVGISGERARQIVAETSTEAA